MVGTTDNQQDIEGRFIGRCRRRLENQIRLTTDEGVGKVGKVAILPERRIAHQLPRQRNPLGIAGVDDDARIREVIGNVRIKPGRLPTTEDRVEQSHSELLHQSLDPLRSGAELSPRVHQVLLQIPLNIPTLLVGDREDELRFPLLWLRADLRVVTHPHAGRLVLLCGDMGDGELFHPVPLSFHDTELCSAVVKRPPYSSPMRPSAPLSTGSSFVRLPMRSPRETTMAWATLEGMSALANEPPERGLSRFTFHVSR